MREQDPIALSKKQYEEIMQEIWKYHRFGKLSEEVFNDDERMKRQKCIKYVRPNWDMREGQCFSITFDPGKREFHAGYGETVPMYDRIMEWLNSKVEG